MSEVLRNPTAATVFCLGGEIIKLGQKTCLNFGEDVFLPKLGQLFTKFLIWTTSCK